MPEFSTKSISDESVSSIAREVASRGSTVRRRGVRSLSFSPNKLLTVHDMPSYLKDNEFILKFYRAPTTSIKNSFSSLFSIHNETGNIYTHLLGFLLFVFLTIATGLWARPVPLSLGRDALINLEHRLATFGHAADVTLHDLVATAGSWEQAARRVGQSGILSLEETLSQLKLKDIVGHINVSALEDRVIDVGHHIVEELHSLDFEHIKAEIDSLVASVLNTTWPVQRWPVYVFTAGAMACMLISSICHLFGCCAAHIAQVMWRFDYAGIAVLIVTSFYPPVYYTFMCQPTLRLFYLASTTVLGILTLPVTLMPIFQSSGYHRFRAGVFVALGMWGAVPLLHGWLHFGGVREVDTAMMLDLAMGMVYLSGAAIYALRIPERWKPGAFDLMFHSHQLFHVAVVIAAVIHYKATLVLLHWRDESGGCLH